MQNRFVYGYQVEPPRKVGPLRSVVAALLLVFGTLFGRIGALFTGTAHRWVGQRTVALWRRSVTQFQNGTPGRTQPATHWERRLVHVGSSVLFGIGGTLLLMWLLLIAGGALFWVASHGYGHFLLLGAVVVGALVGRRLARQGRVGSEQDRLN